MSIKRTKLKNLKNKKIALLGLGTENLAFLKFILKKKLKCEITVCDQREKEELGRRTSFGNKNIKYSLGKNYDKNLENYDIVLRSPGYPFFSKNIARALKTNVDVISPIKLFFELSPTKNIIGVTGTKGKGTTSSLIYEILKAGKKKVYLGGNIGIPPFSFLDKLRQDDWVVLELSSFQLEDLDESPHIGIMTNIFKEHLAPADPNNPNYHKGMQAYLKAKLNIFKYQKETDLAIINEKFEDKLKEFHLPGKKIYFSSSNLPSQLIGDHNKENIAAAEKVAQILKIERKIVARVVEKFKGLPHRIEFVTKVNGIKYYDDSFATTPKSSIVALKSFPRSIVLLAGGADKGSDFKEFAREIEKKVSFLILFSGNGTDRLKKELKFKKEKIRVVRDMVQAVETIKKVARRDNVVLLSAGCASFGVFKNYKDRGNQFKKEVKR